MTIEVKIISDSVGPNDIRLTTFVLKYPRFIHSEFMAHRVFSRNASSSRAIPFHKQLKMIKDDMAMPIEFRKNQKGMQAGEVIEDQETAKAAWIKAGHSALEYAEKLAALGVHKQYVNRLVEPFSHISVVCTATEYSNFFALRHHSMAQPEIAELAKQMWDQYSTNQPKKLVEGQWHLPFVSEEERQQQALAFTVDVPLLTKKQLFQEYWLPLIKRSVARCARVSYLNHDGTNSSVEQDYALYDRLLKDQPAHLSPAEHQAECLSWVDDLWYGNFWGWKQYRKTLENENITHFEGPLG